MTTVLVTGASGFIGSRLLPRLAERHDVVALSRRETLEVDGHVRANFASYEDLQALNEKRIDVAVHLASELGGCSEQDGLTVNVLGTRTLLRYLVDHGCSRFVLTSSIAANGCLSEEFIPDELPISDDHPCEATDAYGLSKAMMEEIAEYFHRQSAELEITMFRLGVVLGPESPAGALVPLEDAQLPFATGGGVISLADAIEGFASAVEQPLGPGVRRMNLVGDTSNSALPVVEALGRALGERAQELDLATFEADGAERRSLYASDRFRAAYGFTPASDLPPTAATAG